MPKFELPIETLQPTRNRGLKRVLSISAIVFCGLFFVCSGCCFFSFFLFRPQVVDTTEGAMAAASMVTEWKLPESFEGKSGLTMDNMMIRIDIAKFVHREGRGILIVGQMHLKMFPFSQQQSQLRDFMEKTAPELKMIDLSEHTTRTLEIRGVPTQFEIGVGEDRASTTLYRQVTGNFRGKLDEAVLILQCEEGFITEQEIDDFLNSIK
jgi:hypothetical protein